MLRSFYLRESYCLKSYGCHICTDVQMYIDQRISAFMNGRFIGI